MNRKRAFKCAHKFAVTSRERSEISTKLKFAAVNELLPNGVLLHLIFRSEPTIAVLDGQQSSKLAMVQKDTEKTLTESNSIKMNLQPMTEIAIHYANRRN